MENHEMDPCECIWSHEMAMRRLISWLRQSQAYCTDTECIDDVSNLPNTVQENGFLMVSMIIAFAIAMFLMRPQSMRNQDGSSKPRDGAGPSGPPPATF